MMVSMLLASTVATLEQAYRDGYCLELGKRDLGGLHDQSNHHRCCGTGSSSEVSSRLNGSYHVRGQLLLQNEH